MREKAPRDRNCLSSRTGGDIWEKGVPRTPSQSRQKLEKKPKNTGKIVS
jgi:hypothetical protein